MHIPLSKMNRCTFPIISMMTEGNDYAHFQLVVGHIKTTTLAAIISSLLYRYLQQDEIVLRYHETVVTLHFTVNSTLNDIMQQWEHLELVTQKPTMFAAVGLATSMITSHDLHKLDIFFLHESEQLTIYYHSQRYSQQYITELVMALTQLFAKAIEDSQEPIVSIALMPSVPMGYVPDKYFHCTLIDLLNTFSDLTTNSIITIHETITYQQLHQQSNQLAYYLIAKHIIPGDIVGIYCARDIDMVIAILAVLKSGAAYLPLDPQYPLATNIAIMNRAKPKYILSNKATDFQAFAVINYQVALHASRSYPITLPMVMIQPTNPAYILYTSGSTGEPKGIVIQHHSVVALLNWAKTVYSADELARVLFATSICFDLSIFELFLPLTTGNTLVLVNSILELYQRQHHAIFQELSLINTVPSAIYGLLDQQAIPASVMTINLAGEKFGLPLLEKLYALPHIQKIYNCYGPSETTVYATVALLPKKIINSIPIGQPIAGNTVLITDAGYQPVPMGMPGEILIAGSGLMYGYLHQPIQDAFIRLANQEFYATGDIGYAGDQGNYYYIGRKDQQIKLRGYRIELEAIEYCLMELEPVKAVCVVKCNSDYDEHLVAHVETDLTDATILEQYVRKQLPTFMCPSYWRLHVSLPKLPNGKLNRTLLQELPIMLHQSTTVLAKLMTIWKKILDREDLEPTDKFFEVGGHSLLLTQLINECEREFGCQLSKLQVLANPTPKELANFIETQKPRITIDVPTASSEPAIGILGIALRFPDANTPLEFWENICQGKSSIRILTDAELLAAGISTTVFQHPDYVKASAIVPDIEYFDYQFFKMSLREAELLDPQQRLLLMCCWHALEDGGYACLKQQRIGVFSSVEMSQYLQSHLSHLMLEQGQASAFQIRIANDKDYAATRIAYKLNLQGPAVNIQTACSSSLVAVHMAKQSLHRGECDLALVCAASLHIPQVQGYRYEEGMVASPDGHCRAFDRDAKGTVFGNGVAAILLAPVSGPSPQRHCYAIIKGSAINNDAAHKVSYTAPSVSGQVQVIHQAQENAQIYGDTIALVEGHGTGTILGDAVELEALTQVYRQATLKLQYCALGSVKPNIGHLESVAGLAGLIKAALAIQYAQIPPSIHFEHANPNHHLEASPFYIPTVLTKWPNQAFPRRAAVSSFGIGGTNAHVILEQSNIEPVISYAKKMIFVLSAVTQTALLNLATRFYHWLEANPTIDLVNLCFTLQVGRAHFKYRLAYEFTSLSELVLHLRAFMHNPLYLSTETAVCRAYISDATIDWLAYYDMAYLPSRISLPTYEFDKHQCWVSKSMLSDERSLLGKRLLLPLDHTIRFETYFSAQFPYYTTQHRLFGNIVVPGSSHLAMFVTAILETHIVSGCQLHDIYFREPLLLPESGKRCLHLVLDGQGTATKTITLLSLKDPQRQYQDDAWVIHATADILPGFKLLPQFSLEQIQKRCHRTYTGADFYKHQWVPGTDTGDAFRWLAHLWVGVNESLALVKEPLDTLDYQQVIQPGLIETGFQLLNACWEYPKESMEDYIYVPYHVDDFILDIEKFKRAQTIWSYTKIISQGFNHDSLVANIHLLNETGESFLMIHGFKVRKLFRQQLQLTYLQVGLFEIQWLPYLLNPNFIVPMSDKIDLCQQTQQFWSVSVATATGPHHWIDLTKINQESVWETNFSICQKLRDNICQLIKSQRLQQIKLIFIVSSTCQLAYASLLGYLRAARQEWQELRSLWVEIDTLDAMTIKLINQLAYTDLHEARIQHHSIVIPTIVKSLPSPPGFFPIHPTGSYLITGGGGTLGMIMANWLISQGATHLVLLGRSQLSREKLSALTNMSANVEYYAIDITQKEQLAIIDFRQIRGIIHCAGILKDSSLCRQTDADLDTVLAPKVKGTFLLHELSLGAPLDFFINFSSTSSVIGSPGQTNYAAANAFLDAFAHYRHQLGLPALTINWGLWQDSQMYQGLHHTLHSPAALVPADALAALATCSANDIQKIITLGNLQIQSRPQFVAVSGSIKEKLLHILTQILGINSNSIVGIADRGLQDLGLDSLMAIEYRRLVQETFKIQVAATFAFDYPTLSHAIAYIESLPSLTIDPVVQLEPSSGIHDDRDIAIIGMAYRFPGGAKDAESYWQLLSMGHCAITEIPVSRWQNHSDVLYAKKAGFLEDIAGFDPSFFNLSKHEAEAMDPQHRLLLETTWHALEDALIPATALVDTDTSIFIGLSWHDYEKISSHSGEMNAHASLGNMPSMAAGRIAHFLGTRGPTMVLDTSCSSSLVAIHQAVQSLRSGEASLAIAGGVSLMVSPESMLACCALRALSPTDESKVFDDAANGYVRGEGVGILILKHVTTAKRDCDRILGIIKGSAVNHDGQSSGLTVPNRQAQVKLLYSALQDARLTPQELDYIEAHGTGTALGDPIEVGAIADVQVARTTPLYIGSVKANIGHLEAAAGIASLVKAVLILQQRTIPCQINIHRLNQRLDWDHLPIIVPKHTLATTVAKVGVSAFGMSGTNAHIILAASESNSQQLCADTPNLLVLSAKSTTALRKLAANYLAWVNQGHALPDLCYSLQVGRSHLPYRLAGVVASIDDVQKCLTAYLDDTPYSCSQATGTLLKNQAIFLCGGTVDWTAFYTNTLPRKIPLLPYPFQQEYCWIVENGTQINTPMDLSYIQHHKLKGQIVCPGVAYINVICHEFMQQAILLKNVEYTQLCWIKANEYPVFKVVFDAGTREIAVMQEPLLTTHCRSVLSDPEPIIETSDALALYPKSGKVMTGEEFYQLMNHHGHQLTGEFQAIIEITQWDGLHVMAKIMNKVSTTLIHPGILDACFQASILLRDSSQLSIPQAIDSLFIKRFTSSYLWAYITLDNTKVNVQVYDENAECVVIARGIQYYQPMLIATHSKQIDFITDPQNLAQHLVAIIASLTGFKHESIEHHMNFSALGFDSLMWLELKEALEDSLSQSVDITVLFNYPTVEQLSSYLYQEFFHHNGDQDMILNA